MKEIQNISPRVPIRYRNTRGSLGELEIAWKHPPYRLVFPFQFLVLPFQFLVLPNFHSCFFNCMETGKMFSIFLKFWASRDLELARSLSTGITRQVQSV